MSRAALRASSTLVVAVTLCACASIEVTPKEDRSPDDPWEPLNRRMYGISDAIDRATLKPIARGYKKVLPSVIRRGVTNFSQNLFVPRSIINNFLQGSVEGGFSEFARFMVNSTVGIGGLFDVTGASGLPRYDETFRQTFAVWGIPKGPFVYIPILGPFTVTDVIALPLDLTADPLWHYNNSSVRTKVYALRVINLRSRLLAADKLIEASKDPYITVRESFFQNRLYEIYNGNPPIDDDFYDEFDDDFDDADFEDEPVDPSESEPR